MHSARWNHQVDLADQHVVVVGSGASAIQLVPEVAKLAKNLTVLQRSPPYILPRPDRPYSETEKQLFRKDPESMAALRHSLFWDNEFNFAQRRNLKSHIQRVKKSCLQFLKQQIDDAELQRAGWQFWAQPSLEHRKLWGTDVYTDDSDVLAMCVHAGWIEAPHIPGVPEWLCGGGCLPVAKAWKALSVKEAEQTAKSKAKGKNVIVNSYF